MSALTVWQGIEERLRTIADVRAVLLGEPSAIEDTPALIVVYSGAEQIMRNVRPASNQDGTNYTFTIRLAVSMQNNGECEMQLITLADAVPNAIADDIRLGGRLSGGFAQPVQQIQAGYATYSQALYRIVDYTVIVLEKVAA